MQYLCIIYLLYIKYGADPSWVQVAEWDHALSGCASNCHQERKGTQ